MVFFDGFEYYDSLHFGLIAVFHAQNVWTDWQPDKHFELHCIVTSVTLYVPFLMQESFNGMLY